MKLTSFYHHIFKVGGKGLYIEYVNIYIHRISPNKERTGSHRKYPFMGLHVLLGILHIC